MTDQQIQEIEIHIDDAKKDVEFANRLDRLRKNKDFIAIVEKGFFRDEAERVCALKASPHIQGDDEQAQIDNIIVSIGGFRQYLRTINQLRTMALQAIAADEQTRDELLIEQLGVTEV